MSKKTDMIEGDQDGEDLQDATPIFKNHPDNLNSTKSTSTRSTLNQEQAEEVQDRDEVTLHIAEQEDQEFPEELNLIINQIFPIDSEVTETRMIYLNNDW